MDLHTPTTLLLIVLVGAVLAVTLGVIAWRSPSELALCAGAMALQALAFALFTQRGRLDGLWTVVMANLALSAAAAVLAEAVYRFQQRQPPRAWIWTPVLLATVAAAALGGHEASRVAVLCVLLVLQSGVVLRALWQRRRRTPGLGQYLLAAGVALQVPIALNRLRPLLEGEWLESHLFSVAFGQAYGFAAFLPVLLLAALGMLSMVHDRAEAALQASRAGERFRSEVLDRLSGGQPLPAVLTAFALGVERLRPGCWCHLVLRPAPVRPPLALAAELPVLPGAGGVAARVSESEDDEGPQAAAFVARAARAGLVHCTRQALLASDQQRLGTLLLACRDAEAAGSGGASAEELARLAALAVERSADAQRVRDSERQYRELIESANEGICVLQAGIVRYVNPKVRELSGYAEAQLLGRPFLDFVHAADRPLVQRNHQRRLRGETTNLRYPVRLLTRDRGARWFEISGVALGWQGQPATLNFLTDITERKLEDDLVHELAYHDTLTGLANRRLLLDHLELALAGNRRHGRHGALIFLDLDHFKPLNDEHGHHVGDLLLVEVARRLTHCVRELDTVARFGGDEFVVLLGGLATDEDVARQQAAQVAEKARRALAEPYVLTIAQEGRATTVQHRCTASVGLLLFGGRGEREDAAEALLDQADAAMYEAKDAGGNVVNFRARPTV
jgi:diguanylate cyclase (GGDEF)-like protein/PAS domain S-box-containing protein